MKKVKSRLKTEGLCSCPESKYLREALHQVMFDLLWEENDDNAEIGEIRMYIDDVLNRTDFPC